MANFTYNNDIPDTPNSPSADQPLMKINTNSIDDLIEVDHVSFNTNDGGYHKVIHQNPQVSDPAAIPGTGQTYVKTVSGDQELFYESGLGVVTQLTPNNANVGSGSLVVTTSFGTILTVPQNCIGFMQLRNSLGIPAVVHFMSIGTTLTTMSVSSINTSFAASGSPIQAQASSLNVQVKAQAGDTYSYAYTYWTF